MIATPVPKPIVDALQTVEIRQNTSTPSGFSLQFSLDNKSILNTLLLLLGEIGPFIRVILTVQVGGIPQVLMDGVMDNHQVTPDLNTGNSTLTVTGTDLTKVMSLIDYTGIPYPAMPVEARIPFILSKYAIFGIIPIVIPTISPDVPIPIERIPIHEGCDLCYINQLARDAGYIFYIDPGPVPGTNTAYWGPEIRIGIPQPPLNVNMDVWTNVESLNVTLDGSSRSMPIAYIYNRETHLSIPVPIPDIDPLKPPLGAIPPPPVNFENLEDTGGLDPIQAISRGIAEASRTSDSVTINGTLDVTRYGNVLKSRGLVGLRGAGIAFDGLYYVKQVTHRIERGKYTQDFSLTRNGLISTVPLV